MQQDTVEGQRVQIVEAERLNPYEIVICFSDQTTAIVPVEMLLQMLPERVPTDGGKPGQ